jgi:hypothetical protein
LPKTKARVEQVARSLRDIDQFFFNFLEVGEVPEAICTRTRGFRAERAMGTSELKAIVEAQLRRPVDARELKAVLKTIGSTPVKHKDLQGVRLPPLITARQKFNAYIEHEVFDAENGEADWSGPNWGQPMTTEELTNGYRPQRLQLVGSRS